MCAIFGALLYDITGTEAVNRANDFLRYIWQVSHERGRDGRGYSANSYKDRRILYNDPTRQIGLDEAPLFVKGNIGNAVYIGNLRAEPTTEFVKYKVSEDQQPYLLGNWSIVHNGTIANDKELRTHKLSTRIDSAAVAEILEGDYPRKIPGALRGSAKHFLDKIRKLRGSYAILAHTWDEPDQILIATNYRPVWYVHTEFGVFFASARHYFPYGYSPQMVQPYSVTSMILSAEGRLIMTSIGLLEPPEPRRALVVCSGGLDSVVAAAQAKRDYEQVELLHFKYGSRAQEREIDSIRAIGTKMGLPINYIELPFYKDMQIKSPLLNAESKLAGGEAGAEFAYEWVPARNLVMLSLATAFAEGHKFDTLVLGNNLEEAGAYPDNEPEFVTRFNDLLPFAIGDGKQVRVEMPVGNLMKHEIVALGHALGAPLDLTWSCYRRGAKHCGRCGPCYMRRKAFEINNIPEVIEYEV
jgi:7-cyano-7-deazaguanine synthase